MTESRLLHLSVTTAGILISKCVIRGITLPPTLPRHLHDVAKQSCECMICGATWPGEREGHPRTECPISLLLDGLKST